MKPRCDLGVIHVRVIAAARADEFERFGVAAFEAAVHDADRLAPHECRPAVTGLPGEREYHPDPRPHPQPRVMAIMQTRGRDSGQAGNGHRVRVRVSKTAHPTHRQAVIPAPPGSRAAYSLVPPRLYTQGPGLR